MYVGSVDWFLSTVNDLSECIVTIFDCESGMTVWYAENYDDCDIALEVNASGFGLYEMESCDIWVGGDGKVHLEINISIEEDE